MKWCSRREPLLGWLYKSYITDDLGLEERIVEVVKMHVYMISWDQDGENTKNEWGVELVAECVFDAVLFAVGEAVGG